MVDALTPGTDESPVSAVSWAAILAGGVASAALTLLMLAFGTGMGFSVVSPWTNSGVSSTTFSLWAGLYLIVVAMTASSIGGYLAGRLRTKWSGVHTHEVYFRDTAHGFLAWAFATVLSAAVLASAAAQIVGGASAGLAQAAGSAAGQSTGPMDGYVEYDVARRSHGKLDPCGPAASRSELARFLTSPGRRRFEAEPMSCKWSLRRRDSARRMPRSAYPTLSRRRRRPRTTPAKPRPTSPCG